MEKFSLQDHLRLTRPNRDNMQRIPTILFCLSVLVFKSANLSDVIKGETPFKNENISVISDQPTNVTRALPTPLPLRAAALSLNSTLDNEDTTNWIVINLPSKSDREQSKQVGPPVNPVGDLVSKLPCTCKDGNCACCTGMLLQALRSKGCMNLKYVPDDFAFVFEMKMNNHVLYKNKISGRNPDPICVNPPRIPFIEVCATFYDVYFFGRNMHACMELGGYFQGYELFSRSFDCLRVGAQGVRIVRPGDEVKPPKKPTTNEATDAEIDSGDGIEDYDENLVRRFDGNPVSFKFTEN